MRDATFSHAGKTLRAIRRCGRHHPGWTSLCIVLIAAIAATIALPPRPRLLWNASASAPVGLWSVDPDAAFRRGDMVAARLAEPWRRLAARRHYLPANVPLIKRVTAVAGDKVCADDGRILVNGAAIAMLRTTDAAGRPMPRWRGCMVLDEGAVLLLMDDPASFDGRYFGPTARGDIIGKAAPLWLR